MSETKYTDAERPIWVPYWPNTLGRLWQAVIAIVAVVAIAGAEAQMHPWCLRGRREAGGGRRGDAVKIAWGMSAGKG